MNAKCYLAATLASAALLAGAAPAGANIILNSLSHNSLVMNALAPTGSAAVGPQLRELNGVAVEAATLPACGDIYDRSGFDAPANDPS